MGGAALVLELDVAVPDVHRLVGVVGVSGVDDLDPQHLPELAEVIGDIGLVEGLGKLVNEDLVGTEELLNSSRQAKHGKLVSGT